MNFVIQHAFTTYEYHNQYHMTFSLSLTVLGKVAIEITIEQLVAIMISSL